MEYDVSMAYEWRQQPIVWLTGQTDMGDPPVIDSGLNRVQTNLNLVSKTTGPTCQCPIN